MKAKAYCVKCKAPKAMANAVEQTLKNGRKALKGNCQTCGTGMFKILGGKSAPAAKTEPTAKTETTSGFRLTFFDN